MKRMKRGQLLDDLLNVLVLVKVVVADVEIVEWRKRLSLRRCVSVSRSTLRTNDYRTDGRLRQVKVDYVCNLRQSLDRKLGTLATLRRASSGRRSMRRLVGVETSPVF